MNYLSTIFLKGIRRAKGITQKQMAETLGYESASGYTALENGQVKMTVDQLVQIRNVLNLTNEEIIHFFLS